MLDPETEVINAGARGWIRRVKAQEGVLEAEFTEGLILRANRETRQGLIERLGAGHVGDIQSDMIDAARLEDRGCLPEGCETRGAGRNPGSDPDGHQPLQELAAGDPSTVIKAYETLHLVMHAASRFL